MQSGDRDGWLALMADDVTVEDPIGAAVTNPDGTGVRGVIVGRALLEGKFNVTEAIQCWQNG